MSCEHESFDASVAVNRIGDEGKIRNYVADIKIKCATCGEPFNFIGVARGLSFTKPTASINGTELHAPICPGEAFFSNEPLVFDVSSRKPPS